MLYHYLHGLLYMDTLLLINKGSKMFTESDENIHRN